MKTSSFKLNKLFQKKSGSMAHGSVLVPGARLIWEGTIIGLIFLAIFTLLFDGYIFVYKVIDLEEQSTYIGEEGEVATINRALFKEITDAMRMRAEIFANPATSSLQNPFEKTEKKK